MNTNKNLENNSIPVEITDQILLEIPNEMWKNPNIKFCYASITDSYIIDVIIEKLFIGLCDIIKNDDERLNHIYNNMVYGIALNKYKARLIKSLTKIKNIFVKNIIEDDLTDMPKFDYIIQNPPYNKTMHLNFLEKGLDILSENGKMIIIEPATWLINVRKNGNSKLYDEIKSRLGKHVYKVIIENFNKEFGTSNDVPFSITYIDLKNEYNEINFQCCGEHKLVNKLYDCNLVGSYNMIWSILNKIQKTGEKIGFSKDHICNIKTLEKYNNMYFLRYAYGQLNTIGTPYKGNRLVLPTAVNSKNYITLFNNNMFLESYVAVFAMNDVSENIPTGKKRNKPVDCLFGTKQELENWKHFIFNNKLPLFTSIVLVIDQHNTCKDVLCWLTDKQYTDEEIYNLLGITEEEQEFIDKTIKKYERHSPWFKRYMCGKDSVSSEEVQKFIDNL